MSDDDGTQAYLSAVRAEELEPDDGEDWEVMIEGRDMPLIVPNAIGKPWNFATWPGGFGDMGTKAMYCFDEATGKYTIEGLTE